MAAAIHIRVGDLDSAKDEVETYLALEPNDLNVRINWIGILLRRGEQDRVVEFLRDAPDYEGSDPQDRIQLAQIIDQYGEVSSALELGYRVLRENWRDERAHLGFMGLLLFRRSGTSLLEPTEVDIGTAFFLEDGQGGRSSYLILTDTDEPGVGEIRRDHPIARSALGKSVGDVVTVEKNPYQTDEFRVVEIKSKYLHALHVSIDQFPTLFPSNRSFMPVSVVNADGQGMNFDPIFRSLSDRQDYVLEIQISGGTVSHRYYRQVVRQPPDRGLAWLSK